MLAPTEVLEKARIYLGEIVPDFASLEPNVEEMVLDPRTSNWNITFAALSGKERPEANTLADLLKLQKIRKVVSVEAENGSLIAVRNPAPF